MQKKDKNALRVPGMFALFGGGIEKGETIEQALMREIQEELTYVPHAPVYFSRYEGANSIFYVFIEEVDQDFERHVKVEEGEYGKFLTSVEIEKLPDVSHTARLVIHQLADALTK